MIRSIMGTKKEEGKRPSQGYGAWRGIPREAIQWSPTIMDDLCNACRACLVFCHRGVFGLDEGTGRVHVSTPYACVIGCNSCAARCEAGAISFPPRGMLGDLPAGTTG